MDSRMRRMADYPNSAVPDKAGVSRRADRCRRPAHCGMIHEASAAAGGLIRNNPNMHAFELADLAMRQVASGHLYLEFLREATLSAGLYVLPAGTADPQQPHQEDELYVVLTGRGQIRVSDEDRSVQAGSIVFVSRGAPHYFHTIEEDLRIIVFFAPPESA